MRAENAEVLSCFETREELQTLAISIPSLSTIPPIHDSLDPLSRIRLRRLFAEKSFSELNKVTQKITNLESLNCHGDVHVQVVSKGTRQLPACYIHADYLWYRRCRPLRYVRRMSDYLESIPSHQHQHPQFLFYIKVTVC